MLSIHKDTKLWFIALIAWWKERIASSYCCYLIRQFDISGTEARNNILYYQKLLHGNQLYPASYKGFLDLVLERFPVVSELMDTTKISAQKCGGRTTKLCLKFQQTPLLKPAQQNVLTHDHQMQQGKLHSSACLTQYLLQEMQVCIRDIDISSAAQQLALVNLKVIKS